MRERRRARLREALAGLAVLALGATLVAVMVEPRTPHADEQRALYEQLRDLDEGAAS